MKTKTTSIHHEARSLIRSLTGCKSYADRRHHVAIDLEIDSLHRAIAKHRHNPCHETFDFLKMCRADGLTVFCRATGARL